MYNVPKFGKERKRLDPNIRFLSRDAFGEVTCPNDGSVAK